MEQPAEREFDLGLHEAVTGAPDAFGESFVAPPTVEDFELGEGLEGDPAIAFRRTLGMFATGVTVLTTRVGEQVHGMTANAFMSVSLQPPLVLISIDRRARMNDLLHEGRRFGVNVLEAGQAGLSDRFAGRVGEGTPEPRFAVVRDTPLIEGALAHLVARVVRSHWGGDHSLFLGHVEYAHYGEGEPLLFHGGRYERVVRDPRLFSELPREAADRLFAAGAERDFADGELLMRRGDADAVLYLVLEGSVRVERPGRVVRMGTGEVVGEIEVLDAGGRLADVYAEGPVRAVAVTRERVREALSADPEAAWALLGVLASRFREGA